MSPHLRVLFATPTFALGAGLMLLSRKILGDEGAEIVDWWPDALLREAREIAADEHDFALACEERYAALERYVLEGETA
jgi:hypothetical protein